MGFLVPLHHYCGQDILALTIAHQQGAAQALFADFCTTFLLHRLRHRFVRFDSEGNHFCLCRSDTAYASEVPCSNTTPSMPISGVR